MAIEARTPRPGSQPVAYIRRSVSRTGDAGDVSREFQTSEVRRLAGADAASLTIIDQDWGISAARDKTEKRLAFLGILAAVERGEVSAVYAYSLDRLARSLRWAAQLLDACELAGTTIVTREGRFAPGDSGARVTFSVLATMNENAVRGMAEKASSTADARRIRGDVLGAVPYGHKRARGDKGQVVLVPDPEQPLEPIREAWERSGHRVRRAVGYINAAGITAQRGGQWDRSSLLRLIRREWPETLPLSGPYKRNSESVALFSKLLVCHCGTVLTPNRHVEKRRRTVSTQISYYCYRAMRNRSDHPRAYVSETIVRPWIEREAARLRVPFDATTSGEDATESRRAALDAKRRQVVEYGLANLLGVAETKARTDAIDAELALLDTRQVAMQIIPESIDWTAPIEPLNAALRALFERVVLDEFLRPVRAEWRVPEWRRPASTSPASGFG